MTTLTTGGIVQAYQGTKRVAQRLCASKISNLPKREVIGNKCTHTDHHPRGRGGRHVTCITPSPASVISSILPASSEHAAPGLFYRLQQVENKEESFAPVQWSSGAVSVSICATEHIVVHRPHAREGIQISKRRNPHPHIFLRCVLPRIQCKRKSTSNEDFFLV